MMRFVFISFYFIYTHRCRLEPAFLGAVCFRVRVVYSEVKCRIVRHHVFRSLLTVNFVPHHRISFITSWKHFRGNFSNVWGVYSRPSFCLSIMVIFVTLGCLYYVTSHPTSTNLHALDKHAFQKMLFSQTVFNNDSAEETPSILFSYSISTYSSVIATAALSLSPRLAFFSSHCLACKYFLNNSHSLSLMILV